MSTVGMRKRYTSVMEKIIKNAVSETSKVLETVIAELKAEVLRVKSENENLKIRCSQFEEVVKKRSIYRETGTSPEPWIIEKCDKAVQCDFILHLSDDDDPNVSDNETRSESSFGPIYEKESSNDSFSFSKTENIEGNSSNPLDLSNETTTEKPVAVYGKNISEGMLVDRSCLDPQFDNMESNNTLETPTHSSEQENLPTLYPHDEQLKESDTCYEASGMKIQEDVCVEYAKTDQSILECPEAGQKDLYEKENLHLQDDTCVFTQTEDVTCENSKAKSNECESSPLLALPAESASSFNAPQQAIEETTEMDIEIDQQSLPSSSELKTGDSSTADITDTKCGNDFEQEDASADVSSPPDQPVTILEDNKTTEDPTESEQTSTEIDDTAVKSVSTECIHAKDAQKTSQPTSPPKSQYFLRRQRCTSVTLEDAMLLLDAVSQQKYKSPPSKKSQAKVSSKNVATPKFVNIPEVTAPLGHDSSNSEEMTCTAESLQPHATHSNVAIETAEALELDVCPANMDIEDQQHQETNSPSKPSSPVEAVIDGGVPTSTSIKQKKKSTQVTEADSDGLNIADQHDHQNVLSAATEESSTLVPENTTCSLTPTEVNETMQTEVTNTTNMDTEEHDKTAASPAETSLAEPPNEASVSLVALTSQNKQISKQDQLLEMEENELSDKVAIESQQHDPKHLSATPTKSPVVQLEEGDHTEYLSAQTKEGETVQVTAENPIQKDSEVMEVNVTPPAVASPSKLLSPTLSVPILQTPVEIVAQISGHPTHDGSEFQESDHTVHAQSSPPIAYSTPLFNPPTHHTMLLKLPGDTGDQLSSVVKTLTSSSTLSSAQLSAVVSAVRSTQSRTTPTGPSVGTPSGKKALVAVPFSLQSVMRPHHKIIVIPRQCKVQSAQAIAKDKAIVLKQKAFATEATTTFISTTDVDPETASGEGSTINSTDQQQTTSVTTTTQSPPETSVLIVEPSSSDPVKSPCKNTVQIKLNRIQFPVSSAQSVTVADMPKNASPRIIVRKKRGRPPLKKKKLPIDLSQPKAQQKEDNLVSPIIGPSPRQSNQEATPSQSCPGQNAISTEEEQSPTPEQLSPVVAADHSYPQHRMTKSQFLAKLEVSPVTQSSKKADSIEKDVQKASLVDRLRSHLKPHIKTIKKAQKPETGQDGSNLTVAAKVPTSTATTTHEASRPAQDQLSENLPLPEAVPHNDENKTVTPKISPAPRAVSNKAEGKRKQSPKRNVTPTKTVKRRKLNKKGGSNENIPSGRKLSPMRNKIINSNALLSCVRKGIKKKSFLCKFCRKEFSKKKDIEVHIQVHVGKKPFQCNICHRRFSRTMELSRHLKRHNAEKKYQCTSCGKAFIEYNNLKRHTYIHTGEKPYSCPHCPRAFTQSGHMRTHIKNKHKDAEDD